MAEALKLKFDDKGSVVVQDGFPVYVLDDGSESPFDAAKARGKITELNAEAKSHREKWEAAEAALVKFKDIDPAKAREAMETMAKLDQKKLIDAGEVDKVKSAIEMSFSEQLNQLKSALEEEKSGRQKDIENREAQIYNLMVTSNFSTSKFANESLAVPPDMVEATFGKNFKVEDGRVVAYDSSGKQIYSRKNAGELAEFDEALEILVAAYPHKDRILKSTTNPGGGMNPNAGGKNAGTRIDTSKMSPSEKLRHAHESRRQ